MPGSSASRVERRKLPRPRFQRAFLLWFKKEGSRFAVPVRLGRRTDRGWDLPLGGGTTSALQPWLHGYGIAVDVQWQAMSWDLVLCLDAAPRRTSVGYVDDRVLPKYQRPYETREALWREEVFEPFLSWVNDVLAPACCLGIWQTEEGGATWAKLLAPGDMAHPDVARAYALLPMTAEPWDRSGAF